MEYNGMLPNPSLNKNEHIGLAIASLILGGIGLFGFWLYGLSVIPALIGAIFGLICAIKGQKSVRTMGIIGFVVCVLAIIACVIVWYMIYSMVNWDNLTWEVLEQSRHIDRNNPQEVMEWAQQFLNIDLSSFNLQ